MTTSNPATGSCASATAGGAITFPELGRRHLAEVIAAAVDLARRTVHVDAIGADQLAVEYYRRGTEIVMAAGGHDASQRYRRAMHWRIERSLVTVMLAGNKLRVIEAGSYGLHGIPVRVVDDEGDLDGDAPTFELVVS